jgi:hypothetical protein
MQTPILENMDVLGAASPTAGQLAEVAAAALGMPGVELLSATAAGLAGPLSNMTTGGLWRVTGTVRQGTEAGSAPPPVPFSTVAKLIQSPLLWTGIGQVPPRFRDELVRHYRWRTEAEVYASQLAEAMPAGGRLPGIYRIEELDTQRTALWLEDVSGGSASYWTDGRFQHAAALLGRLAGSPAVREAAPPISETRDAERLRFYLNGVVSMVLIPGIRSDDLWKAPAVAAAADPHLIAGLRSLCDRAGQLLEEVLALPVLPAHGDASPQNFLPDGTRNGHSDATGFVVIDWGLYGGACPGFDLGQLLAGWVNEGALGGEELYRLEPLCLAAYCAGLAEAGADVPESAVRRGHAASMALFAGLQAIDGRLLGAPDSPELRTLIAGRADMARFVLDLLAATD